MIESKFYDNNFYKEQEISSYNSGRKILPIVNKFFGPQSVVDIGCGLGNWLKVWHEDFKIKEYLGVEGPYINPDMLMVPRQNVIFADLKEPLILQKRYDLAMSMEVAEHIPTEASELFVQNLINASDVVLFSAAIPGQEGTYHINEQNPEFWASIFKKKGYVTIDCIRKDIWNDSAINYWYRQNVLLFVKQEKLEQYPDLQKIAQLTDSEFLLRIHPELLAHKMKLIDTMNSPVGYLKLKAYELKLRFRKKFK